MGERLRLMLSEGGLAGVDMATLPVRLGAPRAALGDLLRSSVAQQIAGRVFEPQALNTVTEELIRLVEVHHVQHPLDSGVQISELRSALALAEPVFEEVLRRAVQTTRVELHEGSLRRPGWQPQLDVRQSVLRSAVLDQLQASRREPPATAELIAQHGQQVVPLLRLLEKERLVVSVEPMGARYFEAQCLNELVQEMQGVMVGGGEHTPAALRDALGMSRKFLIPFLEYCDREGITERRGGGRVLAGRARSPERDVRGSGVA
jgi:selenocysteine-specific elongation factor